MDIGSSIAVFLVLSLLLLTLFCFLTKYFHHKLKKALQETAEIYSMVDELSNRSEGDLQEDYDNFLEKEKRKKAAQSPKEKSKDNDQFYMQIEMSDLKTPIHDKRNIYGDGILKQKLNEEQKSSARQDTRRSMASLKDFRPDRLQGSNRTGRSMQGDPETFRSKQDYSHRENDRTKHTFINKLVCYDSQGISIVEITVTSIKKLGQGSIKEKKKHKTEVIPATDLQFDDQLEIYGFERDAYGCCKYETTVEVENMKLNQEYLVSSLRCSQKKENIEVDQYIRYKFELSIS